MEHELMEISYISIALLIFILIILRCTIKWINERDCPKNIQNIPGPLALPILGSYWVFFLNKFNVEKLHEYYQDLYKRYGDIVKEEFLFNIKVINVFSKSDIEKVLRSRGKYPIRPPTEATAYYRRSRPDRYASTGLVNEQGETWHYLRVNLTKELVSPKTISDFLPKIQEMVLDFCHLVKNIRDSNNLIHNLDDLFSRFGLEVSCHLALGRRMGFLLPEKETNVTRELSEAIHENFLAIRDTYFSIPFWKLFNTSAYKKLVRSENKIYELIHQLIEEAADNTQDSVVFQSIMEAEIDEREKIAAVIDFIAAGIHTLKNSLMFLLYNVAKHPSTQKKILNDHSFTKSCTIETFRLLPTAYLLAQITSKDLQLSGYDVKAGTVVVCHTGIACQDEKNFQQANEFRPERWLGDEKTETLKNSTYLVVPFGAGRRICPGKRLIEQVLPVVLQQIVNHFEIEAQGEIELVFEFLLAAKPPVSMYFRDRC